MVILDKLIKDGWWGDSGESNVVEIATTGRELVHLRRGEKIIKQDPEGAFLLVYLPAGKFESKDVQFERLPIANEPV